MSNKRGVKSDSARAACVLASCCVQSGIGNIHVSACAQGLHALTVPQFTAATSATHIHTVPVRVLEDTQCTGQVAGARCVEGTQTNAHLKYVVQWLAQYLTGTALQRRNTDQNRPEVCGTVLQVDGAVHARTFTQRMHALLYKTVPFGHTISYAQLAHRDSGFGWACAQAVGQAMKRNTLMLLVPCHRVVKSDGGMGGFAGDTQGTKVMVKQWLIDHEIL